MAPEIDAAKLDAGKYGSDYHVVYYIYNTDDPKKISVPTNEELKGKQFVERRFTGVCFSQLRNNLSQNPSNRLLYFTNVQSKDAKPELTLKERREWIKMARKNKALPGYLRYDSVGEKEGKIVLDISEMSPSLCYAYLCNFRYIRDNTNIVKIMLYLVNELGIDFYVAFVVAHKWSNVNNGHCTIEGSNYLSKPSKFPVSQMVSAYRFFANPKKYDTRTMANWTKTNKELYSPFGCQGIINDVFNMLSPYEPTVGLKGVLDNELSETIRMKEKSNGLIKEKLKEICSRS